MAAQVGAVMGGSTALTTPSDHVGEAVISSNTSCGTPSMVNMNSRLARRTS
ncbi:hypothetical protein [Pyrobaculum sp.]|uniref:hypothetical protein n=1 Tax=Pyrobaculum sp. TaxID=2004705 RepID=UPI003180E03F